MRYKRAVEKLRIPAETCERVKTFWFDTEPFLKAVYAFGEVVDGADPLDAVHVAVAINLSPQEVPWESSPEGTDWLVDELRLSKGGFMYFWRSCLDPIWNHYIRGPVRIWSVDDGPDEQALTALEARDFESLKRLIPEPADERLHLRADLGAALAHLREVRDKYWIIAGGAGTVAPAATRRTNCGMRSRAISTCLMPPGLAIRTPEVSVCSLSLGTRSTGRPKSFPGPPAGRNFRMFTQLNGCIYQCNHTPPCKR
jgi:hypothetical protein